REIIPVWFFSEEKRTPPSGRWTGTPGRRPCFPAKIIDRFEQNWYSPYIFTNPIHHLIDRGNGDVDDCGKRKGWNQPKAVSKNAVYRFRSQGKAFQQSLPGLCGKHQPGRTFSLFISNPEGRGSIPHRGGPA